MRNQLPLLTIQKKKYATNNPLFTIQAPHDMDLGELRKLSHLEAASGHETRASTHAPGHHVNFDELGPAPKPKPRPRQLLPDTVEVRRASSRRHGNRYVCMVK